MNAHVNIFYANMRNINSIYYYYIIIFRNRPSWYNLPICLRWYTAYIKTFYVFKSVQEATENVTQTHLVLCLIYMLILEKSYISSSYMEFNLY